MQIFPPPPFQRAQLYIPVILNHVLITSHLKGNSNEALHTNLECPKWSNKHVCNYSSAGSAGGKSYTGLHQLADPASKEATIGSGKKSTEWHRGLERVEWRQRDVWSGERVEQGQIRSGKDEINRSGFSHILCSLQDLNALQGATWITTAI